MTLSELEWLDEIFDDTKHRAASLRQQSYLLPQLSDRYLSYWSSLLSKLRKFLVIFTARRHALHGLCRRKMSVRPSICLCSPSKTFWNIFTSFKSFCVKFCKFVGSSYPHISTKFYRFILVFHQMALQIPTVFMLSSFEYSPIKWKCSGPDFRKWRHFVIFSSSRV